MNCSLVVLQLKTTGSVFFVTHFPLLLFVFLGTKSEYAPVAVSPSLGFLFDLLNLANMVAMWSIFIFSSFLNDAKKQMLKALKIMLSI